MTEEQKAWMEAHPEFKPYGRHGAVSIYGWADVGYLFPNGELVPEGQHHSWAWPTRLMSSGDTLYVIPDEAFKVGREYMVA